MPTRESARRFHFLREIASGGFGSVYLCKVMHADGFSRLAAVKLLKAQWNDNEEIVHRIRDEARLLGLLRHRNIVDVMDLTSIDGRTAVIMEYLEAVDFRMIIAELTDPQLNAKQARLPVRAALEAMAAVAGALDAAYNRPPIPGEKPLRVIHRDIKPSNIMLDDTGMVKVLDFGVARSEIENRESHTRELQFGSVDYMAPERLFFEPETPASDVYSLSATLFEILALEKLGKARGSPDRHATHLADRLSYLRAQIGLSGTPAIELEALLRSGLAFDHESRPTAAAFFQRARALARLMESEELTSWSERELPPMVSRFQSDHRKDNPLFDRVLTEDSLALVSANLDTKPPPVSGDIQRGALSELSSASAVFTPSPATGAPRLPTLEDAPDLTDPGGWEDIPTTIGTANLDEPIITRHHVEEKPPLPIAVPPDPSDPLADAQTISMLHPAASSQKMAHTEDDPTIHMRTPLGIRAGKPRTRQPETPDTPPPEDTAPSKKPAFSPLWIVIGIIGGCLFPVSIIALGAVVFVLNAQENISAREVEFAEEYASRVEGEAVAGEAVAGEAAGGEAVTVDSVAGEDVAGEDVAGEDVAGEDVAGEGIAGEGVAGEGIAGEDVAVDSVEPETFAAAEEAAAVVEDAVNSARAEPSGITFSSLESDTAKVIVRCDEEKSRGAERATIALASANSCTVTAIRSDRSRLTAVVPGATAGSYTCFVGGESKCERE